MRCRLFCLQSRQDQKSLFAAAIAAFVPGDHTQAAVLRPTSSFSVSALSQGSTVPSPTLEAFLKARRVVLKLAAEEAGVVLHQQALGRGGETRLCVEFLDPALGGAALAHIQNMTQGVDLIDIAIEPCLWLDVE